MAMWFRDDRSRVALPPVMLIGRVAAARTISDPASMEPARVAAVRATTATSAPASKPSVTEPLKSVELLRSVGSSPWLALAPKPKPVLTANMVTATLFRDSNWGK